MSVLAIYGAGGLGREVLELAEIINSAENRWDGFVFIADGGKDMPPVNGVPVLDYPDAADEYAGTAEAVVAVGEPLVRKKLFEKLEGDGCKIATLIHPGVHIPKTTTVGRGTVIQQGCFISCNTVIGENVYIQPHVNVGHDCVLESCCELAGFCNVAGNVRVGECSYLALSACIKQGVTIGKYSIVGMGSAVSRNVEDNVVVLGNPARVISRNASLMVF